MINIRNVLITFAEELNKKIEKKGVTYRQVAFAARVTKGSMVHYKSGNCFPELYTLILIADYLECSVNELLGYSDYLLLEHNNDLEDILQNEDTFSDYFLDRLIQCMKTRNVSAKKLFESTGIALNIIEMYLSIHRWIPRVPDFLLICDAL